MRKITEYNIIVKISIKLLISNNQYKYLKMQFTIISKNHLRINLTDLQGLCTENDKILLIEIKDLNH